MLHLYQSNRLEDIAAMLAAVQRQNPLGNFFAPEEIIIQSQGMRRYISQYLARETGIAANLRFSLPASLAWRLMRESMPNIPALSPFSSEVMRWRLLALFQSAEFAQSPDFSAARQALAPYLNNGDYAAYQLAGQLADVFDQYLVYRPDWIEAWAAGKLIPELARSRSAEQQIWQAQLWQHLDDGKQGAPHRVQLWRTLMQSLAAPNFRLPQRYFVFGIATLAPMYLHLLAQLAQHSDVHIFALNPSQEYWGNIIEPTQILSQPALLDLGALGHPLLASLGKQGRDFFNTLSETDAQLHIESYENNPQSPNLLHSIQHQIQTLTLPDTAYQNGWLDLHQDYLRQNVLPHNTAQQQAFQAAHSAAHAQLVARLQEPESEHSGSLKSSQYFGEVNTRMARYIAQPDDAKLAALASSLKNLQLHEIATDSIIQTIMQYQRTVAQCQRDIALAQLNADPSIQIHSAHSPLRELQILKDQLLVLLAQHPDWQPHDIAILTPHIEPYTPYIEAIFGKNSPHPLPYTLSDTQIVHRQPLLDALEQILALIDSRFEADKLLALLDNELILATHQLTRDDLPLIHDTVAQLNIRWGSDAAQRSQHSSQPNAQYTWQQGLERLVLGFMLPDNPANPIWHHIAPHSSNPSHQAPLSRFAALVATLIRHQNQWQTPASIPQWNERIHSLISDLITPQSDADHQAHQQLETALANWQNEAQTAHYTQAIDQTIAIQHLNQYLTSQNDAGFLRGGITICSMVPMRSLPFKVICLLGLNDGDYPRNTKAAPYDLIAQHPQKGDRARRDDDRYLFLEAILSAREVLYLSYIGKDIRTDEERAPSTLIGELIDTIAALTQIPASQLNQHWITHHPLQPFSPKYYTGSLKTTGANGAKTSAINFSAAKLISTRQDYAQALNTPQPPAAPFLQNYQTTQEQPENTPSIAQADFLRYWRNPSRQWLQRNLGWQAPYTEAIHPSSEPFGKDNPRQLDTAYTQARQRNQDFAELATTLTAQSQLPTGEFNTLIAQEQAIAAAGLNSELIQSPRHPDQTGSLKLTTGTLNYALNHNHQHGQILYAHQFLPNHNTQALLQASDSIELLLRHLIYSAIAPQNSPQPTHYLSLHQSITLPPISPSTAQETLAQWLTVYQQGQQYPIPFFPRVTLAAAQAYYTSKTPDWDKAQKEAQTVYHKGYTGFAQADYPETKLIYGRDDDTPINNPSFRNLTENLFANLADCLIALQGD